MESLQAIKPKTLPENKYAYLDGRTCLLDFGTSKVLLYDSLEYAFQGLSALTIKELFNGEYEKANSIKEKNVITSPPEINWYEIPINIMDAATFNSISSGGETIYWHGKLEFSKNLLRVSAAGYIYFVTYEMPKLLEWISKLQLTKKAIDIDHSSFYYLYQMFKKVTKTKPQIMKIGFTRYETWITNETNDFYVILNSENVEFSEKRKSFESIEKFYTGLSFESSSVLDRIQSGKDENSIFKHLTKCLGDKISKFDAASVNRYDGPHAKLYINKVKK